MSALGAAADRDRDGASLPAAFRLAAQRYPANVAVEGEQVLTYRELDRASDRLASALASRGAGPGTFAGVLIDRTEKTPVAILAVLKAGAAYVPLDPAYPEHRLRLVAEDAALQVLVGDPGRATECGLGGLADIIPPVPEVPPDVPPPAAAQHPGLADPAYVIHTSGSTGRPKGCIVTHGNVLALMRGTLPLLDVGPADRWTLFHSFGFDFSVWELWGALLTGGTAVCVPEQYVKSPVDLADFLIRHRVTVLNQVPSVFRAFARSHEEAGSPALPVRYVIFGGEAVDLATVAEFVSRAGDRAPRMVNMYGVTEATVHATIKVLGDEDVRGGVASPIGVPLPHVVISLRDDQRRVVPDGETGEMWIGGAGVAAGYLNQPGLTAERFVQLGTPDGPRLFYRTGDLARRHPGGELEYLGRNDLQVKVRGFRIEPGEVEAALREHKLVRDVAVTTVSRPAGGQMLVACVVADSSASPASLTAELRDHASRVLPGHMVPARYQFVDELPLTFSGKLDRRGVQVIAGGAGRRAR